MTCRGGGFPPALRARYLDVHHINEVWVIVDRLETGQIIKDMMFVLALGLQWYSIWEVRSYRDFRLCDSWHVGEFCSDLQFNVDRDKRNVKIICYAPNAKLKTSRQQYELW